MRVSVDPGTMRVNNSATKKCGKQRLATDHIRIYRESEGAAKVAFRLLSISHSHAFKISFPIILLPLSGRYSGSVWDYFILWR